MVLAAHDKSLTAYCLAMMAYPSSIIFEVTEFCSMPKYVLYVRNQSSYDET